MNKETILSIENLSIHFGGIHALKQLNFKVPKDQITAIIGPNGAGKTTLFNCITGFYKAQNGQIFYNHHGHNINIGTILGRPFRAHHLIHWIDAIKTLYYKMFGGSHRVARLGISRTFQNIRLFKEMSVIENLLVAQHLQLNRNLIAGLLQTKSYQASLDEAIEKAYFWLNVFNMTEDANRLACELPYGKQRHLEIARSLCTDATLICLDEPAAGLNAQETAELSELIINLKESHHLTILLIEHDMSMVMKISDKIFVLDHGELISQGDPSMIANDPKVIEAYLGVPNESLSGEPHEQAAAGKL